MKNSFTMEHSALSVNKPKPSGQPKIEKDGGIENENDVSLITDLVGLEKFEARKKIVLDCKISPQILEG